MTRLRVVSHTGAMSAVVLLVLEQGQFRPMSDPVPR